MNLTDAAAKISAHPDFTAAVARGCVVIKMYGKDIGRITQADVDHLGHTPTGWGKKSLTKGAAIVWHALAD